MASRPVCSLGRVKLNGSAFSGSTSRRLGYSEMALFGQNTESEMTDQYFKIANVLRRDAHFTVVFVSHRVWVWVGVWWVGGGEQGHAGVGGREVGGGVRLQSKLQTLVYDILPSTTAVFSYAIGSRKLPAKEQFFVGAQTVASLLQTTPIISDFVFFITDHVAYASTNKTTIV